VPCEDLLQWARWFETADRVVAQTKIGSYMVSTVFLGLDHSFGRGLPLLYETMVFADDTGGHDYDSDRYATRAQALAGHTAMVKKFSGEGFTED
jgi:hypothetical protein